MGMDKGVANAKVVVERKRDVSLQDSRKAREHKRLTFNPAHASSAVSLARVKLEEYTTKFCQRRHPVTSWLCLNHSSMREQGTTSRGTRQKIWKAQKIK
eukprot:357646-Rhodomonas_salina.1